MHLRNRNSARIFLVYIGCLGVKKQKPCSSLLSLFYCPTFFIVEFTIFHHALFMIVYYLKYNLEISAPFDTVALFCLNIKWMYYVYALHMTQFCH